MRQQRAQNIKMERMEALTKYCEKMCKRVETEENDLVVNENLTNKLMPDFSKSDVLNSTQNVHQRRKRIALNSRIDMQQKPLVNAIVDEVAFYAYMSENLQDPGHGQALVFQTAVTNVGNQYNHHNGVFTAPDQGVYVFTWTIVVTANGYIYTQIFVNSDVLGAMYTSAYGVDNARTTTAIVVKHLDTMDVVSIRVNMHGALSGSIMSNEYYKSSFSGWKIF
ncbi:C1q-related factor-like isoform X2 [Crassostrea virginica]